MFQNNYTPGRGKNVHESSEYTAMFTVMYRRSAKTHCGGGVVSAVVILMVRMYRLLKQFAA